MNSSSSVSFPCSARQASRIAFEQNLSVREEKHAIANFLHLMHVVRCPEHAARALAAYFADLGPDLARDGGIERSRRLIEQQQLGRFSIAFARLTRVCSPEESTPHLTSRNLQQIELFEQFSMRFESFPTP